MNCTSAHHTEGHTVRHRYKTWHSFHAHSGIKIKSLPVVLVLAGNANEEKDGEIKQGIRKHKPEMFTYD